MDTAWMVQLNAMDRRAMLRDLDAAIERAQAERRPDRIEACLRKWQRISHTLRADRTAARSDRPARVAREAARSRGRGTGHPPG